MKSTATPILVLTLLAFLTGPARAQDEWPGEFARVEELVQSVVGDIPYDRVEIRRKGKVTDVSISLENIPAQFRSTAGNRADVDQVFLATNVVQPFMGEPEIVEFSLLPDNAHLIDHFFGFWVFNFGKRVKLPVEIRVIGQDGQGTEVKFTRKRFKVKKKALSMRFVEGQVSTPGLYALQTILGPYSLTTYFCNNC